MKTIKFLVLCGLTLSTTVKATDYAALQNLFQQLQPLAKKIDEDRAERNRLEALRQQQEQEAANRKAAQEAEQSRQQFAAQKANLAQQIAELSAPPEWRNLPIFHKKLLDSSVNSMTQAGFSITAISRIHSNYSPTSNKIAYITPQNDLVIFDITTQNETIIKKVDSIPDTIYFIGEQSLLLSSYGQNKKTELIDLKGNILKIWNNKDGIVSPAGENLTYILVQDSSYYPKQVCNKIELFDAQGHLINQLDFTGQSIEHCAINYTAFPSLKIIASQGRTVFNYQNGQLVSKFSAEKDHTYSPFSEQYAYSTNYSKEQQPIFLWDIQQGKKLCEISQKNANYLFTLKDKIFSWSPATTIDPIQCRTIPFENSTSSYITKVNDQYLALFNRITGELSLIDSSTLQPKWKITTSYRNLGESSSPYIQQLKSSNLLAISPQNMEEKSITQVYNFETGKFVQEFKGFIFGQNLVKAYVKNEYQQQSGTPRIYQIWQITPTATSVPNPQKILQALIKDKYETTTEYQNRVKNISYPFSMTVNVQDYNADQSAFSVVWKGIPMGIPLAANEARKLDQYSTFDLKGSLSPIDENFLMLKNSSIQLENGTSIPIPNRNIPVKQQNTHQTQTTQNTAIPLSTSSSAKPVACGGNFQYLASQMPNYTDPTLANVRNKILNQSVSQLLADLRRDGATLEQMPQQISEIERAAAEAAITADQTDDGSGDIQRVKNGTLPLNWKCEAIHSSAVCAHITYTWVAQQMKETAKLMQQCT